MLTTPPLLSHQVLEFCRTLDSSRQPLFVPVIAPKGAELCECFANTARAVRQVGGGVQHGWLIWEWPRVLLEAEFHALWVAPAGSYIDLTPHQGREATVLFLPDSHRVWEKRFVANVMKPLCNEPRVLEFVAVVAEISRLRQDYADAEGRAEVPAHRLMPLETRKAELIAQLARPTPRQLAEERKRLRKKSPRKGWKDVA